MTTVDRGHSQRARSRQRAGRTFKRQYVSYVCMSRVVSSTGGRSEKDKENVGRLTLLVAPIRDRTQLNPRALHPTNEQTAAATLTNDRSIERERERERAKRANDILGMVP